MSDIQKPINQHFYRIALKQRQHSSGFSLIEIMVVVIIVGVLAAIAGPSWLAFMEGRKLSVAQDRLYQALQEAQSNAKKEKITWQVSFRENGGYTQWSVHPASIASISAISWQKLDSAIRIVDTTVNSSDPDATTFDYDSTNSLWRTRFDHKGNLDQRGLTNGNGRGRITLVTRNNSQNKKCVIVSTLLGAMRMAQDSACN